ncbi:glycosyltransferase family 2 protein [Thalassotalea psychrophila]|uniref:Glycosyltransferase family 2 protein n=1 Tax=Thalassotalea psychrophila TaxID=3065647 RepID=A0ABY9TR47_9GAMM|nr:glycosyltransferase family 2 protein [Colwelliaceae bacterium SQ149]
MADISVPPILKISIITVCYNSEQTIKDTIESVLAQTYQNIEYIIVDGASTDQTIAIVNQYKDSIQTIISEPDNGIYDAMNKGISAATGDVIGILNSDDFYTNIEVIENIADIYSKKNTDMIFGELIYVNPDNVNRTVRHYSAKNFKPYKLRFGWMPPHPATFIKASVYEQYGLYKTDYKISADYEMFVRLLLVHKLSYTKLDKVIVKMRMGGASTQSLKSRLILNQEIVKACKNNKIYTNLALVLLKIPFKMLELVKNKSL